MWVRTEPITFLYDWAWPSHRHGWHQLTFALRGHLEVETDEARALVPPDCAVWVPAGTTHRESLWGPVTVRTLYVAPGAVPGQEERTRTLAVSPLLRELIVHASTLGALSREESRQAHVIDILLDQLETAREVSLRLPTPRDPRARRLADLLRADPADRTPIARLAERSGGASVRTLERLFRRETGMGVGEWRRQLRLLHAMKLLDAGNSVTAVAFDVGYASPSAFTAAFTARFGVPPTRRGASSGVD